MLQLLYYLFILHSNLLLTSIRIFASLDLLVWCLSFSLFCLRVYERGDTSLVVCSHFSYSCNATVVVLVFIVRFSNLWFIEAASGSVGISKLVCLHFRYTFYAAITVVCAYFI